MAKFKTPIIKALREQGGTFYTVPSASEDIGLNINERNNKVGISHFALLNLPKFTLWNKQSTATNYNIAIKDELQNYMYNLETAVRNKAGYDYSANLTVSERSFWKWLQHEGIIAFDKDQVVNGVQYYKETTDVVKCFGKVASANYRTDATTIYNEIYVQVPSSYGKARSYFKSIEDDNYKQGTYSESTGITGYYDQNQEYVVSQKDTLSMELGIDRLRSIYSDSTGKISFDDLAIYPGKYGNVPNFTEFDFNTVLLYYSIYDSTNEKILATNLFGILFIDGADATEGKISSLHKKKSDTTSGVTIFGNGYSFRVNLKTNEIADNTEAIIEDTGAAYGAEMMNDFTNVIANLSKSVELLNNNVKYNKTLSDKYTSLNNKLLDVINTVNELTTGSNQVPVDHASVDTLYGVGDDEKYGHIKISSIYDQKIEGYGIGLSQNAGYEMYNTLSKQVQSGKVIKREDLNKTTAERVKSFTFTDGVYYIFETLEDNVSGINFNFAKNDIEYQGEFKVPLNMTITVNFKYGLGTDSKNVTWLNDSTMSTQCTAGTYRFSVIDGNGLVWKKLNA